MLHIEKISVDPPAPLAEVNVNGTLIRPSFHQRSSDTIYVIEAKEPEEDTSPSDWNFERRGKSQVQAPPRKEKDHEEALAEKELKAEEETDWKIWALLGAGWAVLGYLLLGR